MYEPYLGPWTLRASRMPPWFLPNGLSCLAVRCFGRCLLRCFACILPDRTLFVFGQWLDFQSSLRSSTQPGGHLGALLFNVYRAQRQERIVQAGNGRVDWSGAVIIGPLCKKPWCWSMTYNKLNGGTLPQNGYWASNKMTVVVIFDFITPTEFCGLLQ